MTDSWLGTMPPLGNPEIPPLFQAIVDRDKDRVERLIARGTNVNRTAVTPFSILYGETPLAIAKKVNNKQIIEMLKRAGATQEGGRRRGRSRGRSRRRNRRRRHTRR